MVGQWVVACLQGLEVAAEVGLMHPKLGHGPPSLHEVEGHGGQRVPLSGLSKAEDVKVPVVLSILHLTQPQIRNQDLTQPHIGDQDLT